MKKSVFIAFICIITLAGQSLNCFAASGYAPEEPVSAQAVYLYSLDTGEVIYEKNSTEARSPASLTKIMTCILALENTKDLDAEIVVFSQSVENYLYIYQRENGSISLGGLVAKEEVVMRKLLYALMLPSANEAAMMIAEHIAGSQEKFAEMMNARAKELGATNTNFVNANGLYDELHTTTAEDIAKITLHAIKLPGFMDIVKTVVYDSGPTNIHDNLRWESTNLMQDPDNSDYYYSGLSGIKTGTLPEAGRCFVSMATRGGFTYLLVVMGSDYEDASGKILPGNQAFRDAATIYDWVFGSFMIKSLREKGEYVAEIPIRLSADTDYVRLMVAEDFVKLVYYTDEKSSVTVSPQIPEYIDAPVKKFDKIGTAKLILSGKEIGTVDLLAMDNVEASQLLILLEKVKSIVATFWFKFAVVFIVLLVIAYIVMMIKRNRNNRRGGYGGGKGYRGGGKSTYKPRRRI